MSSPRAQLLRGGRALADWLQAGGAGTARAPLAWRCRLRWHAHWFDRLQAQQSALPVSSRAAELPPPLLAMGMWRSGTTLLHERLTALPGHGAPRTWQCFNPSTFRLTGPPSPDATVQVVRPMDGGRITPLSPQEDEFAMLLLGEPSLYRGFADPRRLPELADAMLTGDGSGGAPLTAWQGFVEAVALALPPGSRLVLKSPNHTLRLPWLDEHWPASPQVWIGRPLAAVWVSNLAMWQAMIKQYALWPCPAGVLEAFLQRCFTRYADLLAAALARAGGPLRVWVDYADLAAAPSESLQATARALGQALDRTAAEAIAAAHPALTDRGAPPPLPATLQPLAQRIDALHAAACVRWGWRTTV